MVGYCPDKAYFEGLAKGNDRIELCNPVFHEEAMELLANCRLFVLPSRTEGMGRVLLEAMAAKKPIIASRVDGIPYYIKDGLNGLLFETENVQDLADRMQRMLSDPEYAKEIAENGHRYVFEKFSEDLYVENYRAIVHEVLMR